VKVLLVNLFRFYRSSGESIHLLALGNRYGIGRDAHLALVQISIEHSRDWCGRQYNGRYAQ
jgi:hypothetical protein